MIYQISTYSLYAITLLSMTTLLVSLYSTPVTCKYIKTSLVLQWYGAAIAFGSLVYAFVTSDFAVSNVAFNSHINAPLLYKVSAVWSSHQGSLLLWVFIQTGYGALFCFTQSANNSHNGLAVAWMNLLNACVLVFLCLCTHPLHIIQSDPQTTGQGLNPLLEHAMLAIHPPVLYMGYIATTVIFSVSLAQCSAPLAVKTWMAQVRPWVFAAWSFLTSGIVLGSFWAHTQLGWGGWWFWDPVENAALIPWMLLTSMIHMMKEQQTKQYDATVCQTLGVISLIFVLMATFLVRSGAISSVHAFATSAQDSYVLLVLITVPIACAIKVIFKRTQKHPSATLRKGTVSVLIVKFMGWSILTAVLVIGTFYPLVHKLITHNEIVISHEFFGTYFVPLGILVCALAGLSYMHNMATPLPVYMTGSAIAGGFIFLVSWSIWNVQIWSSISIGCGSWIVLSTAKQWRLFKRKPAMLVSHCAVGLFLIFAATEQSGTKSQTVSMAQGEAIALGPYQIKLEKITYKDLDIYQLEQARFSITKHNNTFSLYPQKRFYPIRNVLVAKPALLHNLNGDLMVALGNYMDHQRWQVRISWHPMISGIWLCGLLLVFAGTIALFQSVARLWSRSRRILYEQPDR